jgi:hypothetical protein
MVQTRAVSYPICTVLWRTFCTALYHLYRLGKHKRLIGVGYRQNGTEWYTWYNTAGTEWYNGTTPLGVPFVPLAHV